MTFLLHSRHQRQIWLDHSFYTSIIASRHLNLSFLLSVGVMYCLQVYFYLVLLLLQITSLLHCQVLKRILAGGQGSDCFGLRRNHLFGLGLLLWNGAALETAGVRMAGGLLLVGRHSITVGSFEDGVLALILLYIQVLLVQMTIFIDV